MSRLTLIKSILGDNSRFKTCKKCDRSYLPMSELSTHICPFCDHELMREYSEILNQDNDSFDEIILES